jgi:hypothetical protein
VSLSLDSLKENVQEENGQHDESQKEQILLCAGCFSVRLARRLTLRVANWARPILAALSVPVMMLLLVA